MTEAIEDQLERFAPGFRDVVLARHAMGPAAMEAHNRNYVGGDINGGAANLRQLLARPALRPVPYTTPDPRLFLCSSSTPPGGGVHGMCGWLAARAALRGILR
jgi:phytoene dehydrogenase-like protein